MPPSSNGPLSIVTLSFVAFLNLCLLRALLSSPFLDLHRCRHSSISIALTVYPSRHRVTAPSNPPNITSQCRHPTLVTQEIAAPSSAPSLTVSFISFILL
ncbi:hypothetical protein HN51_006870 [Arachis hypogaea]